MTPEEFKVDVRALANAASSLGWTATDDGLLLEYDVVISDSVTESDEMESSDVEDDDPSAAASTTAANCVRVEALTSYSTAYSAPTTYFQIPSKCWTVQDLESIFLRRKVLVDYAERPFPLNGAPCFRVHPCETSSWMRLFDSSGAPQGVRLLEYIATVAPFLNYPISPNGFVDVRRSLCSPRGSESSKSR